MSLGQVELSTIAHGIAKERNIRDQFPKANISDLLFRKVETSSAIHLYPLKQFKDNELVDFESAADWIFYRSKMQGISQGFGGAVMKFAIDTDEGIQDYELQGPWHSNPASLKQRTGIDLENKYCGWCVILANDGSILHIDEKPIVDTLERGEELANKLAKERGEDVFLHRIFSGVSSTGWVSS